MNQKKPEFLGYKRIPWDQLVRCPLNPRTDYGNLTELQDTIIADGILDDLVVRPVNGKYEVICGERRRVAGEEIADLPDAPCKIYKMSDATARRWMAIEDYQKVIWRPYERGKFYINWMKAEKLTSKDLAGVIGCSESKIKDYSSFARKIDSDVGKKVATATVEGKSEFKTLTFGKARKLTTLSAGVQKALASRITAEGMTEKEVAKRVENIKEIQADISQCLDKELQKKATKEFLKPEILIKTDPLEVKRFLGIPLKEEEEWLTFTEFREKIRSYASKIAEFEKIEANQEENWVKIFYKKPPEEKEEQKD